MEKILFITNPPRRCGVSEMGATLIAALSQSVRYRFVGIAMQEDSKPSELIQHLQREAPVGVIYNWHPATMPWMSEDLCQQVQRTFPGIAQGGIVHDVPPPFSDLRVIIHPDPTFREHGIHLKSGRLLPALRSPQLDQPEVPIIGSFGFGLAGKGFHRVIQQAANEFDRAIVRLHIPFSHYCDSSGNISRQLAEECRRVAGDRVTMEITHDYLSNENLVDWLGKNTINCFFYDELRDRGVSSVIDYALAAGRPLAVSGSWMFRHLREATPSICIEQNNLKEIISHGITPLEPFRQLWSAKGICADYERAVDQMRQPAPIDLTPNRVLSPQDRKALIPIVNELHGLEPDIMSRKFPEAVFQNAFNFQQARTLARPTDSIILIGGYEDPIGPALRKLGHHVTITDPDIDGRDLNDVWSDSNATQERWDMVVSCSVLEHVEDDFLFLLQLHQLLKPGGLALLTTDFNHDWKPGLPKPKTDVRFYTPTRLRTLASMFPQGTFVEGLRWQPSAPYFQYENSCYGFCSLMMRNIATPEQSAEIHRRILARLTVDVVRQQSIRLQKKDQLLAQQEALFQQGQSHIHAQEQALQHQQHHIERQAERIAHLEARLAEMASHSNRAHEAEQALQLENQSLKSMIEGTGARGRRIGLGLARLISRTSRRVKSIIPR
jgi:SAM-dependent methyltransferase